MEGKDSLDTELDRDTVILGACCDAKAEGGWGVGVNMLPMLELRGRPVTGAEALLDPEAAPGDEVGVSIGFSVGVGRAANGIKMEAR